MIIGPLLMAVGIEEWEIEIKYRKISICVNDLFTSGDLGQCAWLHLSCRMVAELLRNLELVPF